MINNTSSFERMSYVDAFFRYNQIKMYNDDEKYTSFRKPQGVYCYNAMPFGLKNAGVTYQRAMTIIFCSHLEKIVECYVNDIAVKSQIKTNFI